MHEYYIFRFDVAVCCWFYDLQMLFRFFSLCYILERMRPDWSRLVADAMRMWFFVLRGRHTKNARWPQSIYSIVHVWGIIWSAFLRTRHAGMLHMPFIIICWTDYFFCSEFIIDTTIAKSSNGGSDSSFTAIRRQYFDRKKINSIMDFLQCQTASKS